MLKFFFYRSDVTIRDRFGPMNIGANTFRTGPLSLNLSFEHKEIEFSQDTQEEEEEEHDLLSSAISEGNFSLHS